MTGGRAMKTREYDLSWCGARRWYRLCVIVGPADFLRRGFWRTRTDSLRGVNVRLGRDGIGVPSVMALAHTHRISRYGPGPWSIRWHHRVYPATARRSAT